MQTLVGRWLRSRLPVVYRRERWETPDGDFLELDFALSPAPADPVPAAPEVLLLHGLEGCSRSGYIRAAVHALAARGIRSVACNFRGRSGEPNRRRESYHAGKTDDLQFVLARLARRRPEAPRGAIGFSLGGNVLLKYLGEAGSAARSTLLAASAVSVPYDLAGSSRKLERWGGRLYAQHFLRSMRRSLSEKAARYGDDGVLPAAGRARTMWAFDDAVTAPLHGFPDAATYYAEASALAYLPRIRIPTLLLHAYDDPLVAGAERVADAAGGNPWLVPAFQRRGGHVGFVERGVHGGFSFWAEAEAARFLSRKLTADPRVWPATGVGEEARKGGEIDDGGSPDGRRPGESASPTPGDPSLPVLPHAEPSGCDPGGCAPEVWQV